MSQIIMQRALYYINSAYNLCTKKFQKWKTVSMKCNKVNCKRAVRIKCEKKCSEAVIVILLALILALLLILSLTLGRYGLSLNEIYQAFTRHLFASDNNAIQNAEIIMFQVRIPRIFAAVFVGAALATAGATYQGLFRNPMVSPDLMGASSGAGFGAAIALLFSCSSFQLQIVSFVFGMFAVLLTCSVSKAIDRDNVTPLSLVLTGLVVSTLFSSFIALIKFVADPDSKLPSITYWLMGGFSSITAPDLPMLMIPILIGIIPMILLRYQLNALAFGDEDAKAMGVNTKQIQFAFIVFSTITISASVAASGIIGWVGLMIPHLARIITGPNYNRLLPASMLLGAIYLLIIDNITRLAFSFEIPIGIITSIIGAPFFIFLLTRRKKSWL